MVKQLLFFLFFTLTTLVTYAQSALPERKEGELDIHFISTGGGSCALIVMPDGTTLLVDAGELDPTSPRTLSPRNTRRFPDYSQMVYQWQADYIKEFVTRKQQPMLDYALITHFHDDHYGGIYSGAPQSADGDYLLSGITGVGDLIGFQTLIDRGWNYPIDLREAVGRLKQKNDLSNYFSFVDHGRKNNRFVHEIFQPGSHTQFAMRNRRDAYPEFRVENIQVNGTIIQEGKPITRMPAVNSLSNSSFPSENHLSAGLLLRYGPFKCYMGGDIPGSAPEYERKPVWHDVESLVAPIVGEVDVTTANHHANRDAMTPFYLSILKPRVIIQEVWSSDHPGHEALLRMTSQKIWEGKRDLFATAMLEANRLVIGELIENSYRSTQGHIVVRVAPKGAQYTIYILNNDTTSRHVIGTFGPYLSKGR